jgi:hypothetical protein
MNRRALFAALALAAVPAAVAAEQKKKGGGATYIQIPTLAASTRTARGRGVITVDVGVDVPDATLRSRCEASLPRLRAAYVQLLQIYAAGIGPTTVPNADYLATELQRETDRVLGRRGARLLLGAILVV